MQNLSVKRRATSILLVLAMLVVAVAVLLPVTTSADEPAEIQNFGVQTRSALSLSTDAPTDLRFICSIGSLDYTEVGFVFSKSNANPTIGGTNCKKAGTNKVYSSIDADGINKPAAENRWWVAVKLTDIPHSFFDGTLYVRAFVTDGSGTRYSDVESTTVCAAKGHTHTIVGNPTGGTATLQTEGTVIGHCDGCNLDNVTEYDTARTPLVYDSKSPSGPFKDSNNYTMKKTVGEIRGDKHFYPETLSPGATDGNDLWFEYSFLWNDSLYYRDRPQNLAEIRLFGFRCNRGISGEKYRGFYYMYLRDNNDGFKTSGDCPFKGHIDYSTYDTTYSPGQNCADDLSKLGNTLNGNSIGRYEAGWSGGRDDSPYLWDSSYQATNGWHRLGFRYHQEVASVSGTTVTYSGYTELYIDGVLCWRVHSNFDPSSNDGLTKNNLLIWTATAEDGVITGYTDNDGVEVEMMVDSVTLSSQSVFLVVGDIYWTCGDGFVIPVSRNDSPAAHTMELGGDDYDDGFFYTEFPAGTTTVYDSKNPAGPYVDGNNYTVRKQADAIRGDKHFYPDASNNNQGNDLWFEYSLLWNDSFQYRDYDKALAEIRLFGFRDHSNRTKYKGFYYLYLLNDDGQGGSFNTSNDCPFKGHIDYSTYLKGCKPDENCADDLSSLGNTLNGKSIGRYAAGWSGGRDDSPYLWDSEYQATNGWHRLGFRYHQEVESVSGSTVTYCGYTELYIDGVLCWRVHTNMKSTDSDSIWQGTNGASLNLLLWTANASGGAITGYTDNDNVEVEMRVDNITSSSKSVFIVVDDVQWTCGDGFVHPVTRTDPTYTTVTLSDGTEIYAQSFFEYNN